MNRQPLIPTPRTFARPFGLEVKDAAGGTAVLEPPPADGISDEERAEFGDLGRKSRTRVLEFEIKAGTLNETERTFEGLGAAFSQDLGGDVIMPGAFKRTIADWKKSKRILPLLDSHNMMGTVLSVIGKVLDAKEVTDGLWTKSQLIDGPAGDEVLRRIKGGFIDGLSIGYRPIQVKLPTDEEAQRGIWRFLKEVQLRELSVCIWPMNPDARIDLGTVKALLAEAKHRTLDASERDELSSVAAQIRALLAPAAPGTKDSPAPPAATGLAPEDPQRTQIESLFRDLQLRSLRAG